jgi:Tat protein translocase TatB subunit
MAFLGGSIGGWELLVVGVVVLILFGPKRIPEIAKTIGKVTAQLRGAAQDFRDQVTKAAEETGDTAQPPVSGPNAGPAPVAAEPPASDSSAEEAGISETQEGGRDPRDRAG